MQRASLFRNSSLFDCFYKAPRNDPDMGWVILAVLHGSPMICVFGA